MIRTFTLLAAVLGAAGVALGAFGAHGLAAHFAANPTLESSYDTAVQYHLIHAVALLGAAWAAAHYPGRWTRYAGWLFAFGIVFFSGSLYVLSLFNARFMGAVAPIGGAALIAGWVCLGIAAWTSQKAEQDGIKEVRAVEAVKTKKRIEPPRRQGRQGLGGEIGMFNEDA